MPLSNYFGSYPIESFAIISIILAIAFIFLRSGKKVYAYGILPLLLVPVVNLIMPYAVPFLEKILHFDTVSIKICLIFIALIAACMLIGIAGAALKKKGARTLYFVICGLFTLTLSMLMILQMLK